MAEKTSLWPILAQMSPLLIYTAGAGSALVTGDPFAAWFTAGAIVLGGGANRALKHTIASSQWADTKIFQRPKPPVGGCGYYPGQYPAKSNNSAGFGFPSGHSQVASFAAMFWSLYIAEQKQSLWSKSLRIILLWLLAAAIFYSRIKLGCHNELQVAVGGAVGAALGAVYFILINKYLAGSS